MIKRSLDHQPRAIGHSAQVGGALNRDLVVIVREMAYILFYRKQIVAL